MNSAEIDLTSDGDLVSGIDRIEGTQGAPGILKFRLSDKLAAIKLDNDLAGTGSEAESDDAFTELLKRIRK